MTRKNISLYSKSDQNKQSFHFAKGFVVKKLILELAILEKTR